MNAWDATIMVLVNLIISAGVCVVAGRIWIEAHAVGDLPALLTWCGALQAVAVLTGVYAVVLVGLATLAGWAAPDTLQSVIAWSGLPAILPLLGIAIGVVAETWRRAFLRRAIARLSRSDALELSRAHRFHYEEGPVSILADRIDDAFGDDEGDRSAAFRTASILLAALLGASVLIPWAVILMNVATVPLPGPEELSAHMGTND